MEAIIHPKEKAPELFKSKFLNKLTWSHPLLIFCMYALISATMIYAAATRFHVHAGSITLIFVAGLFTWTLAEYLMHRFMYHDSPDASYDKGLRYVFHGIHHQYPNDGTKVVLPPVPSILIAAIFFGLFYLLMGVYALAFAPGFMMGYSTYTWIHFIVHKYPSPKRFNFWWKHHTIHHFQQHDRAFGMSTPLWDYVFGTMPEKNRKTIKVILKKNDK
jgi:sterol desaturase/sphingolipid hydroxylase (fatty acid hydroxylase superfamily)